MVIEASMGIILEIHSRGRVRMLIIGTIIIVFILVCIYIYIYIYLFIYLFIYGDFVIGFCLLRKFLSVSTFYLRIRLAYFDIIIIIFIIIVIFISIFTTIIYQSAVSRWDVWACVKLQTYKNTLQCSCVVRAVVCCTV
jgi:hypothetical protein